MSFARIRPGAVGIAAQIPPARAVPPATRYRCDFAICGVLAASELPLPTGSLYACAGHRHRLDELRERLRTPRVHQALVLRRFTPRLRHAAIARALGS
jgi:hypothetical protein